MNHQEKLYNTVSASGIIGIVAGAVVIVVGIASGVLMIVSGARLLYSRKNLLI